MFLSCYPMTRYIKYYIKYSILLKRGDPDYNHASINTTRSIYADVLVLCLSIWSCVVADHGGGLETDTAATVVVACTRWL